MESSRELASRSGATRKFIVHCSFWPEIVLQSLIAEPVAKCAKLGQPPLLGAGRHLRGVCIEHSAILFTLVWGSEGA